jgi:hypothetical protein
MSFLLLSLLNGQQELDGHYETGHARARSILVVVSKGKLVRTGAFCAKSETAANPTNLQRPRQEKVVGGAAPAKFLLLVQFAYHPGSADASKVAEFLHFAQNDDPAVPGLRIPTFFVPDDGTLASPEPQIATAADRVLVVGLRQSCESSPAYRFMPVQLTKPPGLSPRSSTT